MDWNPVHASNDWMDAPTTCPLVDRQSLLSMKWTVEDLKNIEKHVSSNSNCQHPPLKELVFTDCLEGSTPLLMACGGGQLSAVQHIVEVWKVDVNAAATYTFRDELIKGCTPLFVAASQNFSEITQYLIDNGADVSARTSADNNDQLAGLTPLHGSVLIPAITSFPVLFQFNENPEKFNTIRILVTAGADPSAVTSYGTPIWNMGIGDCMSFAIEIPYWQLAWCTNEVVTLLVNLGLSVKLRGPWLGRTILHHWATATHFVNAPTSAILSTINLLLEKGADIQALDDDGLTPVLSAAIGNNRAPNFKILNFFMLRDDIDTKDKIEAMELAAALVFSYNKNSHFFDQAFYFWTFAQNLRVEEGCVLPIPPSPSNGIAEWITSASKEEIEHRRSEWKMQAILVRLRILSSRSWGAVQHYLWRFIYNKFNTDNQLELAWIVLETISRFDPNEKFLWSTTVRVVRKLVDALSNLQKKNDPLLNFQTIKRSVELIKGTDQSNSNTEDFNKEKMDHLETLQKLFSILAGLPEDVLNDELKKSLFEIVTRKDRSEDGKTLLHAACSAPGSDTSSTVQFLLELGSHHDEMDINKNGALHYLAQRKDNEEEVDATAHLLLNAGAHLDRVNNERRTAADILLAVRMLDKKDLPDWCRGVPKLSCLSARVIGKYQVPYDPSDLSQDQLYHAETH